MFALRGLAISFSVFVVVYCVFSLAVCLTWRRVRLFFQHHPVHHLADLLFALRMFPLVTACVITAAFTVPSFLLLEPRSINEPLSGAPLALGICGAVLGMLGAGNAVVALLRASRAISFWTRESEVTEVKAQVPVIRIRRQVPAMTATGILRPQVLLSSSAEFLLNNGELQAALNHEIAHVRRRDNLKKLAMRFVAFPGMSGLESAWLEATEMAADDAAVSTASEALDLAAALIKLSRFAPVEASADLTAALVHSAGAMMNARVERLIDWTEGYKRDSQTLSMRNAFAVAVIVMMMFSVVYTQMLSEIHTATEWLMR